jgi:hypothetical protein
MPTPQITRLIADFNADLITMARQHLAAHWAPENVADGDIVLKYFDSLRRWPMPQPRSFRQADDFLCPQEMEAGWELLRRKIVRGEDIRPHLGREHDRLSHLDELLNEWDVHHLHLGVKPYFKDPNFMDRTKQLVFALITDEEFYAINVYPFHGKWESLHILESLHRNWPELIRRCRIEGIAGEALTIEGRRRLRNSNTQTFTTVSDGTVYAPIGGGVACSGVSTLAVMRAASAYSDMKRLQVAVQEQIETFLVYLRPRGHSDGMDLKAALVGISSHGYKILFSDYGLQANVKLNEPAQQRPGE